MCVTSPQPCTFDQLLLRADALAASGRRSLLGITGAPGAGKSTLAAGLADALGADRAVVVPMDGFHLDQRVLDRWARADRKGAPDTFDADGWTADELVLVQSHLRDRGNRYEVLHRFNLSTDSRD